MITRPADPYTAFQGSVLGGAADTNANGPELIGSTTGNPVQVAAFGDDANIGIQLVAKGTGTASLVGAAGAADTAGGAAGITGGAGTGTGAGGAVSETGGVGGATGAGGAASVTGGAGGSTSGTGGSATVTGGAGSGIGAAGGAMSGTGGAGAVGTTTTAGGAGGSASLVGGVGGAKTGTGAAAGGAGGNVLVTGAVGGATASSGTDAGGVGGDVTVTAGAGGAASAGTGNGGAGGSITLAPGAGGTSAGGAAGVPGMVLVGGAAPKGFAFNVVRSTVTNAATLTAAQLQGQVLFQDASGGSVTMATPIGSVVAAAFPDMVTGHCVMLRCASNHASNTSTLSGASAVTLVGSGAFTQTGGTFALICTGAGTFDLVRVG